MTADDAAEAAGTRWRWVAVLVAATALIALLALAGWADLLMGSGEEGATTTEEGTGLGEITAAIERVRGPATLAFGSVSSLGLLAGGAMTALGMPQGMRMMTMSGFAFAGVLLGNGIVK